MPYYAPFSADPLHVLKTGDTVTGDIIFSGGKASAYKNTDNTGTSYMFNGGPTGQNLINTTATFLPDTDVTYSNGTSAKYWLTTYTQNLTMKAGNIATDTTTGTKIGTATSQKLGFFNATPVVQQTGDIITALSNLGLVTSGTVTGGITRSVSSISTPTTAGATASTDYVYLVSGTTTLTLPTAVGNTNRYTVKNVDASLTTTIATTSAQTIDGSASATLPVSNTSVDLISNGSNWAII